MENIFIILGIVLLLILCGATFWSNRHEKSRISSLSSRPENAEDENLTPNQNTVFNEIPPTSNELTQSELNSQDIAQETERRVEEIQIRINSDEESQSVTEAVSVTQQDQESYLNESTVQSHQEPAKPEMVKLFLLAAQGYQFTGMEIANHLTNLGFVFGEYNIFHRHLDNLSSSPVLYSVADMNPPGAFVPEQMEHMTTNGLLFFMPLPCHQGDPADNLNLLLNDIKTLAEQMQGYIFDDQGKLFDEDSHYRYLSMVRQSR